MICTPFTGQTNEGGIVMKYTFEFKTNCVELYKQGKWPGTPEGITAGAFHKEIKDWVKVSDANGVQALKHKHHNKVWTSEEKYKLVAKVLAGNSFRSVALNAGINAGMLHVWVRKYKMDGYEGLATTRKGRSPKESPMKKPSKPSDLTESEREELIRLREENEYLRTEQAVIKKLIALRQEKAAKLKARDQQS